MCGVPTDSSRSPGVDRRTFLKRAGVKTMVRQAEAILESDPPLLPIAYEKIYDTWHNRVRGQNPTTFFGIYDVVRWDTVSVAT